MLSNYKAPSNIYPMLLELWEKSVDATHFFLSEEDKANIKAALPTYFANLDTLAWEYEGALIGFSATQKQYLEMLFLSPECLYMGYGKQIITWLMKNKHIATVDVNEANQKAFTFYAKNGFLSYKRSAVDSYGKAYPILHLSKILIVRENPHLIDSAARWFSQKWDVGFANYRDSMQQSLWVQNSFPQWYVLLNSEQQIIAGAGVIENDFHPRRDLSPNLCALFVEKNYRGRDLARQLLKFISHDFARMGFEKLYLITDHDSFYEKCGWNFLTWVRDDTGQQVRIYESLVS